MAHSNARMITCSASREHDSPSATHDWEVSFEATKSDLVGVKVDTTTHGVDHGLGLFVDFLLHEVGEAALHDLGELKLKGLNGTDSGGDGTRRHGIGVVATQTMDVKLAIGDVRDVVVLEVEDSLGVLDDCGGVGGDEELDGLREAVLRHERAGLRPGDLLGSGCTGNSEE